MTPITLRVRDGLRRVKVIQGRCTIRGSSIAIQDRIESSSLPKKAMRLRYLHLLIILAVYLHSSLARKEFSNLTDGGNRESHLAQFICFADVVEISPMRMSLAHHQRNHTSAAVIKFNNCRGIASASFDL